LVAAVLGPHLGTAPLQKTLHRLVTEDHRWQHHLGELLKVRDANRQRLDHPDPELRTRSGAKTVAELDAQISDPFSAHRAADRAGKLSLAKSLAQKFATLQKARYGG
jgi:hypothetical protein